MMILPRVSDILSILYPNSLDFVRDEHLERGTRLHEGMEIFVNNALHGYEGPTEIPAEILPVIEWVSQQQIQFQSAEELCTHQYGFSGHPDLLGSWRKIDYWFDWKFSEQITEQNQMQGTAYCYLTGRKGVFVQCPKSGVVKVVKCKPDPKLWSAFLSGLNVWKFHNRRSA